MVGLRLMREVHAVLDSKPLKSKAEIVLIILITITCTVSAVLHAYTILGIGNWALGMKANVNYTPPPLPAAVLKTMFVSLNAISLWKCPKLASYSFSW